MILCQGVAGPKLSQGQLRYGWWNRFSAFGQQNLLHFDEKGLSGGVYAADGAVKSDTRLVLLGNCAEFNTDYILS